MSEEGGAGACWPLVEVLSVNCTCEAEPRKRLGGDTELASAIAETVHLVTASFRMGTAAP